MEFNELKEIIELFSKCNVDRLDLTHEGFNLKLAKNKEKLVTAATALPVAAAVTPALAPDSPSDAVAEDDDQYIYVTSPIVGTFYKSPKPDAPAFVKVGDLVHKGQTLCIVEAMKLMNEIQADHDGEIVKVLVENGQGVEYGQRLFAIRP